MIKNPNSKTLKYKRMEEILKRIEIWETPFEAYTWYYGYHVQKNYIISLTKHGLYGTPIEHLPKPQVEVIGKMDETKSYKSFINSVHE